MAHGARAPESGNGNTAILSVANGQNGEIVVAISDEKSHHFDIERSWPLAAMKLCRLP